MYSVSLLLLIYRAGFQQTLAASTNSTFTLLKQPMYIHTHVCIVHMYDVRTMNNEAARRMSYVHTCVVMYDFIWHLV